MTLLDAVNIKNKSVDSLFENLALIVGYHSLLACSLFQNITSKTIILEYSKLF
jgi:hypothetical protein